MGIAALLCYVTRSMRGGYLLYFLTCLVLGAGLWAVLRLGSAIRAPAEIAGKWAVRWETNSPTGSGYHGTMTIDQSGRYCTFRFDEARTMSFKIVAGTVLGQGDPGAPTAQLEGGGYHMMLRPTESRDAMRLEISGRDHHRGRAERLSPARVAGARAADTSARAAQAIAPVADARP